MDFQSGEPDIAAASSAANKAVGNMDTKIPDHAQVGESATSTKLQGAASSASNGVSNTRRWGTNETARVWS